MYLDERRHELADATIQAHGYRLKQFVAWCDTEDIDNINELSGRDIHRFRVKRRTDDNLATATMKGQMATMRVFLRFCASIDAVKGGLDEKIILPTTTEADAREELLEADRARDIFEFLDQYRYAQLEHALLAVLWHTGLRTEPQLALTSRITIQTNSTSRWSIAPSRERHSRTPQRVSDWSH
jgi:site-specific recombinase XerD